MRLRDDTKTINLHIQSTQHIWSQWANYSAKRFLFGDIVAHHWWILHGWQHVLLCTLTLTLAVVKTNMEAFYHPWKEKILEFLFWVIVKEGTAFFYYQWGGNRHQGLGYGGRPMWYTLASFLRWFMYTYFPANIILSTQVSPSVPDMVYTEAFIKPLSH